MFWLYISISQLQTNITHSGKLYTPLYTHDTKYIHIHTDTHSVLCVCICMCMRVYACEQVYVCVNENMCEYVYASILTCACMWLLYLCMCVYYVCAQLMC